MPSYGAPCPYPSESSSAGSIIRSTGEPLYCEVCPVARVRAGSKRRRAFHKQYHTAGPTENELLRQLGQSVKKIGIPPFLDSEISSLARLRLCDACGSLA